MKKHHQLAVFGFSAAFFLLTLQPAAAAADKLSLKDLPGAARKVVELYQHTAKLGDITKTVEDGETVFEVETLRGDEVYTISVTPDGKWHSVEMDLAETPKPIQNKSERLKGTGAIDNVSKVFDDGDVSFDVEMTLKGRYHCYTLYGKGKVWSHMEQFQIGELTAPVQAAIRKQAGTGRLGDIYRVEEDGEIYISVEANVDGKDLSFSVSPEGKFLGIDE